jgi:hypothetical protein
MSAVDFPHLETNKHLSQCSFPTSKTVMVIYHKLDFWQTSEKRSGSERGRVREPMRPKWRSMVKHGWSSSWGRRKIYTINAHLPTSFYSLLHRKNDVWHWAHGTQIEVQYTVWYTGSLLKSVYPITCFDGCYTFAHSRPWLWTTPDKIKPVQYLGTNALSCIPQMAQAFISLYNSLLWICLK